MIIDIDAAGRITIAELSEQQAELIQNAALFLADRQQSGSAPSRFLRGVAIQIDRLLPKPPDLLVGSVVVDPPDEQWRDHLFMGRNYKQ